MKTREIRQGFVDYFKECGHEHVSSSSLIPYGDETLLFTNAGMNQFKNVFLGVEKQPYKRAVTVQKCVRAGGKHNDLENVGFTSRHHTFFEMLGNFSFGDYFKKDAIHFAWELLTKDFGIPKDRLFVTVFETDDEAADIWHKQEGVPRDRIKKMGEADNFWRMGDTGPCGPCSEIFYDHGPSIKPDDERYVEIWNLVFMQFNEQSKGKMTPLPNPSIDTGSGLERVAAALQGTHVNYETDEIMGLITQACKITGVDYRQDPQTTAACRVLADHARASAFLIGDGVLPSNEGRGYVLRRIMRRAIRYGRKLSETKSILPSLVENVITTMGGFYPELKQNRALIAKTVQGEEERFIQTLDQGTEILNAKLAELKKKGAKNLDDETAFKLYDTFGFPVDLTNLMAREQGLTVDEQAFERRMNEARTRSQASWKGAAISANQAHLIQFGQKAGSTEFTGYETCAGKGKVVALSNGKSEVKELKAGETGLVVFNKTPFYAESGGQAGDSGVAKSNATEIFINDTTKSGGAHLHHVEVKKGSISVGQEFELAVHKGLRDWTRKNHSATHLLHAALRQVLGLHVTQAGSLVEPSRLRFDFTHNAPLTASQIQEIEHLVNNEISKATPVDTSEKSFDDAIKAGAMALFGEKYGDKVRVLKMGDFSTELCGGTHVSNTSEIQLFKIVSEGGVSAGVRRIEALTGPSAIQYLTKVANETFAAKSAVGLMENWSVTMERDEAKDKPLVQWIESARKEIKDLERKLKQAQSSSLDLDYFVKNAKPIKGGKFVSAVIENDDRDVLSQIADTLRDKAGSSVVVVVGKGDGNYPIIVSVSKELTKDYQAGKILQHLAQALGGKGGGRPDFAQGAGKDISKLDKALQECLP